VDVPAAGDRAELALALADLEASIDLRREPTGDPALIHVASAGGAPTRVHVTGADGRARIGYLTPGGNTLAIGTERWVARVTLAWPPELDPVLEMRPEPTRALRIRIDGLSGSGELRAAWCDPGGLVVPLELVREHDGIVVWPLPEGEVAIRLEAGTLAMGTSVAMLAGVEARAGEVAEAELRWPASHGRLAVTTTLGRRRLAGVELTALRQGLPWWSALTDLEGLAESPGLAPGRTTLRARAPGADPVELVVEVPAGGTLPVELSLE
jgi:hypothetical protein